MGLLDAAKRDRRPELHIPSGLYRPLPEHLRINAGGLHLTKAGLRRHSLLVSHLGMRRFEGGRRRAKLEGMGLLERCALPNEAGHGRDTGVLHELLLRLEGLRCDQGATSELESIRLLKRGDTS